MGQAEVKRIIKLYQPIKPEQGVIVEQIFALIKDSPQKKIISRARSIQNLPRGPRALIKLK